MYSYMRYFISILFIACSLACKIRLPMKKQFTEWKKNITFPSINWPKKWFVIPYELEPYEVDQLLII